MHCRSPEVGRAHHLHPLAAESGLCSGSSVSSTYASAADLQSRLDIEKEVTALMQDVDMASTPLLVGPNWIFKDPRAAEFREELGGVKD